MEAGFEGVFIVAISVPVSRTGVLAAQYRTGRLRCRSVAFVAAAAAATGCTLVVVRYRNSGGSLRQTKFMSPVIGNHSLLS